MKMSEAEKDTRASSVMAFVGSIRGAYSSGFIDNNPTNYDIYRYAQIHVKDNYGVDTENWDDEFAKESRSGNHDRMTEEIAELKSTNDKLSEAIQLLTKIAHPVQAMIDEANSCGYDIDGAQCISLANDAEYLKDIARQGLAKLNQEVK